MRPNTFAQQPSVHIWHIQVPKTLDLAETQPLSALEIERLETLANASLRKVFLHVHRAKREILGSYLNISAKDLALDQSDYGKPLVAGNARATLEFNISHTLDTAVIALSPSTPVGIDIEALNRRVNVLALARRYFDVATVQHLSQQQEQAQKLLFLRYWTQFEAYKKATGLGLRGRDHRLTMATVSNWNVFEPFADTELRAQWLVAELDTLQPNYALSVVTTKRGEVPVIEYFKYTPN